MLAALRERRYFLIAEKYSQSPASVREWSDYDFQRALMNLEAENQQNLSPDQIREEAEKKRRTLMDERRGMLLDLPWSHWKQFVADGVLDEEKLKAAGYNGEGQVDWIKGEFQTLGWFSTKASE